MAAAFRWVILAYVAALAAAIFVGLAIDVQHPIAIALWADVAATVVVFAFSFAFRNSSFYDPYWSVIPIILVIYWALCAVPDVPWARQLLAIAGVSAWGLRLTWNWARGWQGLHHEDWRYVDLQHKTGRWYWLVSFSGIHMAPTLWVFVGCLALYPAVAIGTRPLGPLDLLATLVVAGAVWIEGRADNELRRFRQSKPAPEAILSTGLWSWSRHPNYFGEMSFWWGLYLFGLAADPSWWWTFVGPLSITLMFRFLSLPMIETRMLERRPAFAEHQARSSLVIPWPPRASSSP